MFLKDQDREQIKYYERMLTIIGSLSRLSSESNSPYIQYRMAENLFCKAFGAKNHSRGDCSVDASKDGLGIGIKTFLGKNNSSMEKIAEFNKGHDLFKNLNAIEKIQKVCEMRNDRLETTKRMLGLEHMIYHCVTRKTRNIIVYEFPMDLVAIDQIKNIREKKNIIAFDDGMNEYQFNVAKSTLYKRFVGEKELLNFHVDIFEDPFATLESMFKTEVIPLLFSPLKKEEHVFLRLYSVKKGEKIVSEASGLNQWNAKGRKRDTNEVYLPIPAWIHKEHSGFFPPRDQSFELVLPDGSSLSAKVCQDGSKALMSNPNSALGEWLLRDVLELSEKELLTYERLERIGLDSVVIYKISEGKYSIDFTKIGSYEDFMGDVEEEKGGDLDSEDES